MTTPKHNVKACETCKHHSVEPCSVEDGKPVERLQTIHNSDPYWTYETCAKNWGLPKVAVIDGSKCHLWITKPR